MSASYRAGKSPEYESPQLKLDPMKNTDAPTPSGTRPKIHPRGATEEDKLLFQRYPNAGLHIEPEDRMEDLVLEIRSITGDRVFLVCKARILKADEAALGRLAEDLDAIYWGLNETENTWVFFWVSHNDPPAYFERGVKIAEETWVHKRFKNIKDDILQVINGEKERVDLPPAKTQPRIPQSRIIYPLGTTEEDKRVFQRYPQVRLNFEPNDKIEDSSAIFTGDWGESIYLVCSLDLLKASPQALDQLARYLNLIYLEFNEPESAQIVFGTLSSVSLSPPRAGLTISEGVWMDKKFEPYKEDIVRVIGGEKEFLTIDPGELRFLTRPRRTIYPLGSTGEDKRLFQRYPSFDLCFQPEDRIENAVVEFHGEGVGSPYFVCSTKVLIADESALIQLTRDLSEIYWKGDTSETLFFWFRCGAAGPREPLQSEMTVAEGIWIKERFENLKNDIVQVIRGQKKRIALGAEDKAPRERPQA